LERRGRDSNPRYKLKLVRRFSKPTSPLTDKELTDLLALCLPENLPQTLQEHPELTRLIEAWPEISDELRQDILQMILGKDK